MLLSGVSSIAAARYQRLGVSGWAPLAWAMAWGSAGTLLAQAVAGQAVAMRRPRSPALPAQRAGRCG